MTMMILMITMIMMLKKNIKPYLQPGPLSEILTITDLQHVINRGWIYGKPEFRLCWMKLCSIEANIFQSKAVCNQKWIWVLLNIFSLPTKPWPEGANSTAFLATVSVVVQNDVWNKDCIIKNIMINGCTWFMRIGSVSSCFFQR